MSDDATKPEDVENTTSAAEDQQADSVDAEGVDDSHEAATDDKEVAAVDGQPAEAATALASRPAGDYWEAFGKQAGSVYFAEGTPFDKALGQELKRLREQNDDLKKRVGAQATDGHEEAVEFSHQGKDPERGKNAKGELTELPVNFCLVNHEVFVYGCWTKDTSRSHCHQQ